MPPLLQTPNHHLLLALTLLLTILPLTHPLFLLSTLPHSPQTPPQPQTNPLPCPSYIGIIPDGNTRHLAQNPTLSTYSPGSQTASSIISSLSTWSNGPTEYVKGVVIYGLSKDNKEKRGEGLERVVIEQVLEQCRRLIKGGCKGVGGRRIIVKFNGSITSLSSPSHISKIKQIESETLRMTSSSSGNPLFGVGDEFFKYLPPLEVWVLLNYSGREAATSDVSSNPEPNPNPYHLRSTTMPFPLDMIIRSGSEIRLSDFCLLESSYAEMFAIDKLWPDVKVEDFEVLRGEWGRRRRRMGS